MNQKRLRMRLSRKLNVYVFLTTTISTWMNGNLHEPTCKRPQSWKASNQPHRLITAGHFVLVSRIQYVCRLNEHFPGLWARGSLGRVLNHHALLLPLWSPSQPFLCRSSLKATTHKKSRVSEYFLSTSPHIPFKYCFPFQTKLNPCMEFKEKLEPECIILFLLFKETRCSDTLYI